MNPLEKEIELIVNYYGKDVEKDALKAAIKTLVEKVKNDVR